MKQALKTSAVLAVLSTVCIGAPAGGTGDMATPSPAANAPRAGPGLKVYIDPETGEFLEQPPRSAEPAEPMMAPNVALPEPEQVASPEPGGGIMVDVRGRFQTPLRARIGSDGKPEISHGDAPSAPSK